MPEALRILFAGLFTAAACLAAGRLILSRTPARLGRAEGWALALPVGAPAVSLAVFLLCAAGVAYVPVFAGLGIVILFAAAWVGRRAANLSPAPADSSRTGDAPGQWWGHKGKWKDALRPGTDTFWRTVLAVVMAPFGALYLLHAWSPEYSPDGASYHLGLTGRYLAAHGFERITTNMYANLSQGIEMLFLLAYGFGRHSAAALAHLAFLFALPALLIAYARRAGFAPAGVVAACLVFASPVIGVDGSSAYNDVAVAVLLFTVFYLAELWNERPSWQLAAVVGLVAGFCYAVKYTAFLAVPYALLAIGVRAWRKRLPWFPHLAAFSLAAAAMIAPWMLKNWLYLDNPFSPLMNRWFPNPYVYISFEEEYRTLMRNYEGITSYWMIPAQVLYRGEYLAGILGPVFGLAPLALFGVRRAAVRKLLLAGLLFGLPYLGNIGCRFLIPAAPFAALALGVVLTESWRPKLRVVAVAVTLAHAWLSWPTNVTRYSSPALWRLPLPDWRAALRLVPEEQFLAQRLGAGYEMARRLEQVTEPDARILTLTPLPEAYCRRDLLVGYQSAFGNQLQDILHTPLKPEAAPAGRLEFAFPPGRFRRFRMEQTARGEELWSLSEVRVYARGQEIPRAAPWRIRASVNPWDIGSAFDNNPATRWRSWQRIEPGMKVEIDFGSALEVDRLVLEISNDQYQAKLRLLGRDEDGSWRTLQETANELAPGPVGPLRQAAGRELQARGIDYLVMQDSDWGAEDMRSQPELWGLTPVEAVAGGVIYRVAHP